MAFFDRHESNTDLAGERRETAEGPSWLHHLEKMRAQRKKQGKDSPSVLSSEAPPNTSVKAATSTKKIDKYIQQNNVNPPVKNKVYQYYLKKWQEEHNQLTDEAVMNQVLLANQWTLQSDKVLLQSDSVTEEENSILFFNKHKEIEERDKSLDNCDDGEQDGEDLPTSMLKITVVRPNLAPDKNLCVIDEQIFVESIKKQLKPQLQELLEGMIKNMLLNNYEIMLSCVQREIQAEIPGMIDNILEYNIKRAIKK